MKFGIFDHLDRRDQPLGQFYEERLRLVAAADEIGIAGYHTAEHHWNPVGMAPAPGVFLSAVAQRTERIRLGPMGYALAFHNPLILAEEICMLDHLSDGRLDLGIGRGISPWELQMFGVTLPESRDLFRETFEILLQCFTSERVTHRGRYYQYYDVPMELRPLQAPYPPLWYPSVSPAMRDYVARHGMHLMTGWAPSARIRQVADSNREVWEQHKDDPLRARSPAEPYIGSVRQVVIAETDAEAREIAAPARDRWYANLEHLSETFGHRTMFAPEDYDEAERMGSIIAGSPDTVRARLAEHIEETGIDYLLLQLAFGSQTHEDEMRTLGHSAPPAEPSLLQVAAFEHVDVEIEHRTANGDVEFGADQGNPRFRALRIDDRPVAQPQRIGMQRQDQPARLGLVGLHQMHPQDARAALDPHHPHIAGQAHPVAHQQPGQGAAERHVGHFLEFGIDIDQPVAAGVDLDRGRRLVIETDAPGPLQIQHPFRRAAGARYLNEARAHRAHGVEIGLDARHIGAFGGAQRRRAGRRRDRRHQRQHGRDARRQAQSVERVRSIRHESLDIGRRAPD